MFVLVAFLVIEQHAAGEAEDAHNLHQGKAAPRLLGTGLGILTLVFGRVGQSHSGAINDFGAQAVPELVDIRQEFISTSSHRMANALQNIQQAGGDGPDNRRRWLHRRSPGYGDKTRLGFVGRFHGRGRKD